MSFTFFILGLLGPNCSHWLLVRRYWYDIYFLTQFRDDITNWFHWFSVCCQHCILVGCHTTAATLLERVDGKLAGHRIGLGHQSATQPDDTTTKQQQTDNRQQPWADNWLSTDNRQPTDDNRQQTETAGNLSTTNQAPTLRQPLVKCEICERETNAQMSIPKRLEMNGNVQKVVQPTHQQTIETPKLQVKWKHSKMVDLQENLQDVWI